MAESLSRWAEVLPRGGFVSCLQEINGVTDILPSAKGSADGTSQVGPERDLGISARKVSAV